MIIQDLFLYFAKYPSKDGVKSMATMGGSEMPEYQQLMDALDALPEDSLVPEIEHYVYGQSIDDLKGRLDKLVGSFLLVERLERRYVRAQLRRCIKLVSS